MVRNSVDVFLERVTAYLKESFTKRVDEINRTEHVLDDIALWQSGFDGIAAGLTHYPGCLLLIDRRTLSDVHFSTFELLIMMGIAGDDDVVLQKQGHLWEDILEDTVRSDWHLGASCLDVAVGSEIISNCTSGIYTITLSLSCEVDLGGYVYEERADAVSQMRLSGEEESTPEPTVLSTMRGDDGTGEEEREQESAVELI